MRWLRANAAKYHIDPERIGVTGGSAGGHLAQFLGVTGGREGSSRATAAIPSSRAASPASSTTTARATSPSRTARAWTPPRSCRCSWAATWKNGPAAAHPGEPLYWVTPHAAPTLCIHGTEDKYVAHEQAVWLVDRLRAAGVEAELLTLEGAGHGFRGEDAGQAEKALFAFFAKHLKKK